MSKHKSAALASQCVTPSTVRLPILVTHYPQCAAVGVQE